MIDWLFRDRTTGRIVVAQAPNPPLWIFLATVVARWFVDESSGVFDGLRAVGLASLGWWALDEVVRGVNPWRRLLGVGGCAVVLAGRRDLGRLVSGNGWLPADRLTTLAGDRHGGNGWSRRCSP